MPEPGDVEAAYWDFSWNPTIGCGLPKGRGCKYCYAPRKVVPYQQGWQGEAAALYAGVVITANGQPHFNGEHRTARGGAPVWRELLNWPGVEHPKLGAGQPSLVFICTMGDLLYDQRPDWVINRALSVVAVTRHLGLVVTRYSARAAEFFGRLDPRTAHIWRRKFWLVFSAADQPEFNRHWALVKPLAERGWFVGVSCSPLLGAITLPPDFLQLGRWVIVNGECGGPYVPDELLKPMRVKWALALRDQAAAHIIAFFMRGMGRNRPIPECLQIRQFPTIRFDQS